MNTAPVGKARAETAQRLFSEIAPRYDLANRILSFGFDVRWRRWTARQLSPGRGDLILDLCTGTGDLALALSRSQDGEGRVFGVDFCRPMLTFAQEKLNGSGGNGSISLTQADGLQLPFKDGTFDLVTAAFGVRSFSNLLSGLREMIRVLKPGGRLGVLEFSQPRTPLFSTLYDLYFKRVLPHLGDLISGRPRTYTYLPATVSDFPGPDRLAQLLGELGLDQVSYTPLTLGIAVLHTGHKPDIDSNQDHP